MFGKAIEWDNVNIRNIYSCFLVLYMGLQSGKKKRARALALPVPAGVCGEPRPVRTAPVKNHLLRADRMRARVVACVLLSPQ